MWKIFSVLVILQQVFIVIGSSDIQEEEPTQVSSELSAENVCNGIVDANLFENLTVNAIVDEGGVLRLNISWAELLEDMTTINLFVNAHQDVQPECKSLKPIDDINVLHEFHIIRPSQEIKNPGMDTEIIRGCNYTIKLECDKLCKYQKINYSVPDCIGGHCACSKLTEPFKLLEVNYLEDTMYSIKWDQDETVAQYDPEVTFIYYFKNKREHFSTAQQLSKNFSNHEVIIKIHDRIASKDYQLEGIFKYWTCPDSYTSRLNFIIPPKTQAILYVIFVLSVIITALVFIILTYRLNWLKNLLRKLFPSVFPQPILPTLGSEMRYIKEEINPQYTPADFFPNDRFEFPRNKIQIREEIDSGAFGKVYYAKAHEINGYPGFTMVAVKQLRANASLEEMAEFKAEIDMMKTIGEHPNVIKLLGCCTKEEPYMMIMELVPCGSLKNYLIKLRKEWEQKRKMRQNNNKHRIFFPDDMEIPSPNRPEAKSINHFQYAEGTTNYIIPDFSDVPKTPLSPNTLLKAPSTPLEPWKIIPSPLSPNFDNNNVIEIQIQSASSPGESMTSPLLPSSNESPSSGNVSITTSRLPSTTETISTYLENDSIQTPLLKEFIRPLEPELSHTELQNFALQIAKGMAHLEQLNITHRDLAARNVLITNDKTLKISDFGMSRTGNYVLHSNKKMPLRWMAIEAIENRQCDSKSDVWSFGVVLWEIGTLGALPYDELDNEVIRDYLKMGKRLQRPEICTTELYNLMLKCWSENPDDRPTFHEIVDILDEKKRKVYVDFNALNFKYELPPSQVPDKSTEELT